MARKVFLELDEKIIIEWGDAPLPPVGKSIMYKGNEYIVRDIEFGIEEEDNNGCICHTIECKIVCY
jgi:hypothetical protein